MLEECLKDLTAAVYALRDQLQAMHRTPLAYTPDEVQDVLAAKRLEARESTAPVHPTVSGAVVQTSGRTTKKSTPAVAPPPVEPTEAMAPTVPAVVEPPPVEATKVEPPVVAPPPVDFYKGTLVPLANTICRVHQAGKEIAALFAGKYARPDGTPIKKAEDVPRDRWPELAADFQAIIDKRVAAS